MITFPHVGDSRAVHMTDRAVGRDAALDVGRSVAEVSEVHVGPSTLSLAGSLPTGAGTARPGRLVCRGRASAHELAGPVRVDRDGFEAQLDLRDLVLASDDGQAWDLYLELPGARQ